MKRLFTLPVILSLLVVSCTNKTGILDVSNLRSSFIKIDNNKDYHLRTPKGAVIKIDAGSFDIPAGTKLDIEIKEAYSMQDILAAGLTTTSNGKLLNSGGMIYFNVTAGNKPVNYLKPVGITIPSKNYNDKMNVFRGEILKDSSINWVEPKKLDTPAALKYLPDGEALFKANCANCHKPLDDFTGPPLGGARNRGPNIEWAYKFINNVNAMLEYDAYAKGLFAKYGSKMTQFNLHKEDIKAILDYCDNEAALYKPELLQAATDNTYGDSLYADCGYDTLTVPGVIAIIDDKAVTYGEASSVTEDTLTIAVAFQETPTYSFDINYSGWYNIDCFAVENSNNISTVQLSVSVKNADDKWLDVYLCMPSKKLLTPGYERDSVYTFDEPDGKTRLIKGAEVIVFAVGKDKEKDSFYYGVSTFMVKDEQHIIIELKATTKEKINEAIKKNEIDKVRIDKEKPVVEKIIYENPSDSSGKELQLIKSPCPVQAPVAATAFKSK
ncbi:MAG: cytochrome c [Ferruginibacter sp.]